MITYKKTLSMTISTILCASLLPIAGCSKKTPDPSAAQSTATTPQSVYVPPTADQLYQMVGPIALFPDKLVAQVLAGSSYPTQITAADNWIQQNKNLAPTQLQTAINQQPWDVSVKGLVMFPNVLDQMAQSLPWTTALGTAYVNDPTDVMNAIQVMRQRASTSGNLKASKQQKITITPRVHRAYDQPYDVQQGEPIVYSGPDVISPPNQTYVIEPADPNVVYVPAYNPRVVYGQPMQTYPGYQEDYQPPAEYSTGQIVTAGVISFGAGIAIAELVNHEGGWNSWGVHWGGHHNDYNHENNGYNQNNSNLAWHRPAVEYNNSTYVSHSTTVINRVNENNYYNTRNTTNNNYGNESNRASSNNGVGQANFGQSVNGNPSSAPSVQNQPNFNGMHEPHFNKTEVAAAAGAVAIGGAAMAASHFNHPNPRPNGNPSAPPSAPNFNNTSQPNFGHHGWNGGYNTQQPNSVLNQAKNSGPYNQSSTPNQPNFSRMHEPHFNRTEVAAAAGSVGTGGAAIAASAFNHSNQHVNTNPSAAPKAPHFNPSSQTMFTQHGPQIAQPANPNFEHHQWGHHDQSPQQSSQTSPAPAPKPIETQAQHAEIPIPPKSFSENSHHESLDVQAHQQSSATKPLNPQFHRDPISEPQKWGHPPSPQPALHIQLPEQHQAPQQAHPQPAPKAHDNHPHPNKKEEGFNQHP
jgi:hypothetical protein